MGTGVGLFSRHAEQMAVEALDVQQISDIERPAEMRRLLSVVAARMGTLAVAQSIADDVALPRQTLSRYLERPGSPRT